MWWYDFFLHLYTVNMMGLNDWQCIQTHTLTRAGLYQLLQCLGFKNICLLLCGHIWVFPALTLKRSLRVWKSMKNIIFRIMRYKQVSYEATWACMIAFVPLWDQHLLHLYSSCTFFLSLSSDSKLVPISEDSFSLFLGCEGLLYFLFSEAEKRADILFFWRWAIIQLFPYSLAQDGPHFPLVWTSCSRN